MKVFPDKYLIPAGVIIGLIFLVLPHIQAQGLSNDTKWSEREGILNADLPSRTSETEERFEKRFVDIPPLQGEQQIDADDFRDPFFFVRGYQSDAREVLQPGTTVDGIRFNSYKDSRGFIEKFYRNSNFNLADVFGRIRLVNKEGGCLVCHRGISEISENHKFSCTQCHRGKRDGKTIETAHRGMISNPSDREHAPRACGKCHADQIEKVNKSLMATGRGMIEMTRQAWGAPPLKQPKAPKADKKTKGDSKASSEADLKTPPWTYVSQHHRVDDFLDKKCLRCHVSSAAPHRPGDFRATGCAACHMIYTNDGTTLTRDRAIQGVIKEKGEDISDRFTAKYAANSLNNKRGYPLVHRFTVAIPSVQCEHCHNNNGVGNEFEGLFGMPARPKPFRSQIESDDPVLYGRKHEFLLPDIHREKGMHCIDCHGIEEVKADANQYPTLYEAVQVRCETCHGSNSKGPEGYMLVAADPRAEELLTKNKLNPNLAKKIKMGDTVMVGPTGQPLPHVLYDQGKWILYSKVSGKPHAIPVLKDMKKMPLAHQVAEHMITIECSACHARWSASEWGLHAIAESDANTENWKDWNFADPVLQQIMITSRTENAPGPGMMQWRTAQETANGILGNWTPGYWRTVFTESGWDTMILGKNKRGRISIMKPRYQYFITEDTKSSDHVARRAQVPRSQNGRPGLVMVPHTPHTIRTVARPCESCHMNALTAGLGDPNLENIADGKQFLQALKSTNRLLPEFQIKQMVSADGRPIQNAMPGGKTGFLKPREIRSLSKISRRYKAYRYLDLRQRNFSRLLRRNAFPYDSDHKINEKKFDSPLLNEELYYDLDKSHFVLRQKPVVTEPAIEAPADFMNPQEPTAPPTPGEPETPLAPGEPTVPEIFQRGPERPASSLFDEESSDGPVNSPIRKFFNSIFPDNDDSKN